MDKNRDHIVIPVNALDDLPFFICIIHEVSDEILFCNKYAAQALEENVEGKLGRDVFYPGIDYTGRNEASYDYDVKINSKWFKITTVKTESICDGARIMTGIENTENMRYTETLLLNATTDPMTGIYNRQAGMESLRLYAEGAQALGNPFTVCFLDLNDLKYINDTFGHKEGDLFIQTVVDAIKKSIRQTDVFARMGGDEFLILFPKCTYKVVDNIMKTVTNKLEVLSQSIETGQKYSFSYGIQEVDGHNEMDAEFILNSADSKMYYMKEEYRKTRLAGGAVI